jgi:acyl-CoA thioesterase I
MAPGALQCKTADASIAPATIIILARHYKQETSMLPSWHRAKCRYYDVRRLAGSGPTSDLERDYLEGLSTLPPAALFRSTATPGTDPVDEPYYVPFKLTLGRQVSRHGAVIMIRAILFAVIVFLSAMTTVAAAPLRIVAIGASNTQGWYVGNQGAYPAKLQALLKAKGIDAQVINAGVPFDTTAGMLKRIDSDVPTGTENVILQPGANDRRFLGTKEQRAANIAAMERRLRNRSIKVIVYDEEIPFATTPSISSTSRAKAMRRLLLPCYRGSWQSSTVGPMTRCRAAKQDNLEA